jgi:hypothetical protein
MAAFLFARRRRVVAMIIAPSLRPFSDMRRQGGSPTDVVNS